MRFFAYGLCLSFAVVASQSSYASPAVVPVGTTVSIKLSEPIDSARDRYGKQYTAALAAPIQVPGGQTIAAGAPATIVLVHNNSGWVTQLTALNINGHPLVIASSGGVPPRAASAPEPGALQQIGLVKSPSPVSNQHLVLPPATELHFRIIGTALPARYTASPSSSRTTRSARVTASRPSVGARSAEEEEGGIAYLCSAKDIPDRALPSSYYIADVFETSDDPVIVERRWHGYLAAKYPYRFANNPRAIIHCARLADLADERDARSRLERESKAGNAQVIQTRWRYILGPPPAVAAANPADKQK